MIDCGMALLYPELRWEVIGLGVEIVLITSLRRTLLLPQKRRHGLEN